MSARRRQRPGVRRFASAAVALVGLLSVAVVISACGTTSVSGSLPASAPPSAAAVASPAASAAGAPTPSASPSSEPAAPTPTPLPEVPITAAASKALERFAEVTTEKDRSFHMNQRGSVSVDGNEAGTFTYDLDVNGGDVNVDTEFLGSDIGIVAVGDRMWVKNGDGPWAENPRNDAAIADIIDVFEYVGDPADLVYIGPGTEDGQPVERFRNVDPIVYQTTTMKDAGVSGRINNLGLVIRPDGSPVRLSYRSTAVSPLTAETTQTVDTLNLVEISQWGSDIKITPPV